MSDNKNMPFDDKTREFNLNEVDDKTRVFSLKDENISRTKEFSLPDKEETVYGLSDNDEKDFFTDQTLENITEFSKKTEKPVTSYGDDFENIDSDDDIPYVQSVENREEVSPAEVKKPSHMAPKKKKTPVVVLAVAGALVVIAIIVTVIICVKGCSSDTQTDIVPTTATTVTSTEFVSTEEETTYEETTEEETTTEPDTTTQEETTESETEATTVPEGQYYNATFGPYKCVTPEGEVLSDDIDSELGGYTAITLAEDGTFTMSVGNLVNTSGTYAIDGNYIGLGDYSGNINFDDAGNPVGIIASVEGYTIYLN